MFNLTADELDFARVAIDTHGHAALMPDYGEWPEIASGWEPIRDALASLDLDRYTPKTPLRLFAPKSRYMMREVTILHPEDLLIYTALVLIIKNDIEAARVPLTAQRVYSYRADADDSRLYMSSLHSGYRARLMEKATSSGVGWVALADIADFFPRIYQHRLQSAIAAAARSQRARDVSRVLVDKFLMHVARGNSYGIPVGPLASRLLGEAVLIDVDEALTGREIDFVRWVDDFSIFCRTEDEARKSLHHLAWWLWDKHGLTLQATKTRATPADVYVSKVLRDKEERLKKRVEASASVAWEQAFEAMQGLDPYVDPWTVELSPTDIVAIEALELGRLLTEAVSDDENPDYELAAFILDRASGLISLSADAQHELTSAVLKKADKLRPIADRMGRFLIKLTNLDPVVKGQIGTRLAELVQSDLDPGPNEHFAVWALAVISSGSGWVPETTLVGIYSRARSAVVKTYACHAAAKITTRGQILSIRDDFSAAGPLLRLAILRCISNLPSHERTHWRRLNQIASPLEKILAGVEPDDV